MTTLGDVANLLADYHDMEALPSVVHEDASGDVVLTVRVKPEGEGSNGRLFGLLVDARRLAGVTAVREFGNTYQVPEDQVEAVIDGGRAL